MRPEPLDLPAFAIPDTVETPAVCVVEPTMQRNIEGMVAALGRRGVGCRPHTKSHKSIEIARRQMAAGCVGVTTATLGEAEVLVGGGVLDVLVAYPIWFTRDKARRLLALSECATVTVGVSSRAGAENLTHHLAGSAVRVAIEIESGENRTGVEYPADALEIARLLADAHIRVTGVFAHGGHSYAGGEMVARAARDESRVLLDAAAALRDVGVAVELVSAGSTPTALLSAVDGVTEERPGTYVFGDRQQCVLGAQNPADVALFVAGTVVQVAGPYFVLDVGAKILTKDLPATVEGYGALPAYPRAMIERVYDHHGVVHARGGALPRPGERFAVVPNHVCPVVNLTRELVVLNAGYAEIDHWTVDAGLANS